MKNEGVPLRGAAEVNRARLTELESDTASETNTPWVKKQLELIHGVKVSVAARMGSCELTVRELFDLKEGAVLTLDRATDAPIDILLEGKVIARGEIVVVNDNFGVRIVEVSDPGKL